VVIYDICPLREDYGVSPIMLSVLRDLARDTDIIIEHANEILSEVSLTDRRIEDALARSDADLLIFGSYVATRSNLQPMIHIICTYGRPMEPTGGLPEGMDLDVAIKEGDAILQMPRHILIREVLPIMAIESLEFQNALADEIFSIAQFVQAIKLYKADRFQETVRMVEAIQNRLSSPTQWPDYWVPFNYLPMLGGLAYLRAGETQAAIYILSNAIARSTPAKMRIQRCAEQIMATLLQAQEAQEKPTPPATPATKE
jgi:hypothetical protein